MDWIDIKEKQPTAEDYYFTVNMDSNRKQVNYLRWSNERKQFEYYSQDFIHWMWLTVTHWMPFPSCLSQQTDWLIINHALTGFTGRIPVMSRQNQVNWF